MAYGNGSFDGVNFSYGSEAAHFNDTPAEERKTLSGSTVLFTGVKRLPVWNVRASLTLANYNSMKAKYDAGTTGTLVTEVGYSGTARILNMGMVEQAGPDNLEVNLTFIMLT